MARPWSERLLHQTSTAEARLSRRHRALPWVCIYPAPPPNRSVVFGELSGDFSTGHAADVALVIGAHAENTDNRVPATASQLRMDLNPVAAIVGLHQHCARNNGKGAPRSMSRKIDTGVVDGHLPSAAIIGFGQISTTTPVLTLSNVTYFNESVHWRRAGA